MAITNRPISIYNNLAIFQDFNKQLHFSKEYNHKITHSPVVKLQKQTHIHWNTQPNNHFKINLNLRKNNPITTQGYNKADYFFQSGQENGKMQTCRSQKKYTPLDPPKKNQVRSKRIFHQKYYLTKQKEQKIKKKKEVKFQQKKVDKGKRVNLYRCSSSGMSQVFDHQ